MVRKKVPPGVEALSEDSQRLFTVLNEETDVAAVLVGASYLDECLASMLHRFFVQGRTAARLLDSINGPLGSFRARADLAYVLGLLSKPAVVQLRLVGELRNLFAHSRLTLELSSPSARQILDEFNYLAVLDEERRLNGQTSENQPGWLERPLTPRDRFNLTVVFLSSHLLLAGLGVTARHRSVAWVQKYSAQSRSSIRDIREPPPS